MDESAEVGVGQVGEKSEDWETDKEAVFFFLSIVFNLYSGCLAKEALEESGDFKIGGQAVLCMEYADDIVLRTEEKGLYRAQLMDLLKFEGPLGWKRTWKTLKITGQWMQPFHIQIAVHNKRTGECGVI